MLTEEAIRLYVEALLGAESAQMSAVRAKVGELGLIHDEIFPSQMALFRTLCIANNVREILELGTFIGYSTVRFAEILRDSGGRGHITTVERDRTRSDHARELLTQAGLDALVSFIVGEDSSVCKQLQRAGNTFDLIFLDTWEGGYPAVYGACVELLKPRGMLIVDNVLMQTVSGWNSGLNIAENTDDSVLAALRELLHTASTDPRVVASIVPLGSGLLLCSRNSI